MENLLFFIPNMVLLCARLLTDPRVPRTEKALVAGAMSYAIIPFDLIPEMIPFIGQVDDQYLIALALLRLMDRTEPNVLRQHWAGGGDIVQLVEAVSTISGKLLPRSMGRILTAQVEVVKDHEGKLFSRPLLVACWEDDSPAVNQSPR